MKIEETELTDEHINEVVTYLSTDVNSIESGEISSYNDRFVFVRYNSSSQGTNPRDLYFGNRVDEFKIKQSILNSIGINGLVSINDINYLLDNEYYHISINGANPIKIMAFFNLENCWFIIHKNEENKLNILKRELKINKIIE